MENFVKAKNEYSEYCLINPAFIVSYEESEGVATMVDGERFLLKGNLTVTPTIDDTGGSTRKLQSVWHSINEQLPPEDEIVIVHSKGGVVYVSRMIYGKFIGDVTHWMHLPEVPKND